MNPPVLPMLARRVAELPAGGTWIFEPKWDGFRASVFRDGDEILIQSRDEKSLNRYFPELLEPLRSQLPTRSVLDGEIVVAQDGALDFDALQLHIHPATSRVIQRERPGDRQVLVDEIEFRELRLLGKIRLVGVGHTDLASFDRKNFGCVFLHH